jgi:hypothetical protein
MSSLTPPRHGGKKKMYIYIGGGVAAVGVVYFVMMRKNKSAIPATTDPNAIDPNAVDPSLAYGDYSTASGLSLGGYTDPGTGAFISNPSYGQVGVITAPTSNAQWAQQSIAYLTQLGDNPVTASVAIGKFLMGQALNPDEMQVIQAAIGAEGYPPVAVPPAHLVPSPGAGTGIKVPPGGLAAPHVTAHPGNAVVGSISWNSINGATAYRVYLPSGPALSVTSNLSMHLPRHTGPYHVQAWNGAAHSPNSNSVSVK